MEGSGMSNSRITRLSDAEPVSMADSWYEFANEDHFWMQWRFRSIVSSRAIRESGPGPWLDIGCGHGVVIKQFEKWRPDTMDGCDLNVMALEKIGTIRGNIYVYNIFDHNPQLVGKYAGILLLDVIEHIHDDTSFLKASLEHLKPGGIVVINVPALELLSSKYDIAAGHQRRYTKSLIRDLFTRCGIQEERISYWGLSLIPIALVRKFVLLFVRQDNIIRRGFQPPGRLINFFLCVLMKMEMLLLKNPPMGTSVLAVGRKR